jgi:Yip1 domain
MATPASTSLETQQPLSEPERVINTFVAPTKTFTDIRRNASWWVPWLILSVFSLLFVYAVTAKVGWDRVVEHEIAKNEKAVERIEKMQPEQRDQMMQMQANISKYTGYATPIIIVIFMVIVAGALLAAFNFGFGADIKFSKGMAIVAYAWLPSILTTVLAVITMFAGANPEGFDIRNPVATNLGHLVSPTNKFLYSVMSMVDIIAIWMIILLGIGFACNSKVKRGTAIGVVAVLYVAVKLAGAAFSTMF